MAVIGTFGSFTAARLGIYASQSSLNVTGNNIANINTEGYTRQRIDLVSIHSYGGIRYANSYNLNIGYGVLCDSVSQLRDPFLDIRYRNENSNVGAYDEKLDCLQQLSHILDEVGKGNDEFGIIEGQFDDLLQQIENFNGKVGSVEYDTTVRGSAETLVRLFNDYAKAMETLEDNKLKELKEDVNSVNTLLTQIRDLSEEIREAGIHGDKALELRDDRNVCIDKLSAYMKIDVRYDMEEIDEFSSVERINISIADSGNPPIKLIQGIYGAQISMPEKTAQRNPNYDPDLPTSNQYISRESTPTNILYTNIEREALTDINGAAIKNDASGQAAIQGVPGYNAVTLDAAKFYGTEPAPANTHGPYLDANGDPTEDPTQAKQVDNAIVGSDENRLWMSVDPLKDAKGRYMRDEYHKEVKESVDLTDNQLYGSLQALREFLTEKGEFSSEDDIKFDKDAAHKRGIRYYETSLDALARKFADKFNEANRLDFEDVGAAYKTAEFQDPTPPIDPTKKVTYFVNEKNQPIIGTYKNSYGTYEVSPNDFNILANEIKELEGLKAKVANGELKDDPNSNDPADQHLTNALNRIKALESNMDERIEGAYENMEALRNEGLLTPEWAFYDGGVLFSNNGDTNDGTNITAKNITISKDWSTGAVRILNTKEPDSVGTDGKPITHTTRNDNLLHMINLMSHDFDYLPKEIVSNAQSGGEKYFTGSFQERLADMNNILAVDTQTTSLQYSTYTGKALTLENSRQSVSGVDLNDEATNMMVFQKAYSAACQLMTTLDSMLDKLINGTIR